MLLLCLRSSSVTWVNWETIVSMVGVVKRKVMFGSILGKRGKQQQGQEQHRFTHPGMGVQAVSPAMQCEWQTLKLVCSGSEHILAQFRRLVSQRVLPIQGSLTQTIRKLPNYWSNHSSCYVGTLASFVFFQHEICLPLNMVPVGTFRGALRVVGLGLTC